MLSSIVDPSMFASRRWTLNLVLKILHNLNAGEVYHSWHVLIGEEEAN